MATCLSCEADLPEASAFCLKCGARVNGRGKLDSSRADTMAMEASAPVAAVERERRRFEPGTLIHSRYRVISRLGKGGMGEVFRADDIVLNQGVALKFLPEAAGTNLNLLKRFYEEVRIARQITHPNVCRVYDIGEAEGLPYISMEYIDGEDLASLLRRIGRLPAGKATEFARKMCLGLAAAHAQGVLHRDLKPANIMIDGRGELHLMDFGLASATAQLEGAEVRNGTPAYMAPEQLEGREVSVQSDLYALGLVFYEMFTGTIAHQGDTIAEILTARQKGDITNPSTLIPDMEPAVERAIRKCLDPDPKKRPTSALALAASLPGGDPLTAALAAGETPSPEVVAASGATEGLSPKVAIATFAAIVAGLIGVAMIAPHLEYVSRLPLENAPEVLESRARDAVRALGYGEKPADTASGFTQSGSYRMYLRPRNLSDAEWTRALSQPPSDLTFWYRQSPRTMTATAVDSDGEISLSDPQLRVSGMVSMSADLDGRMLSFSAVPPQLQKDGAVSSPQDWSKAFELAKLDPAAFHPETPQWTPLVATDARAAWTGTYPNDLKLPIRVEAAAFQGRLVYFEIIWPWTKASRMAAPSTRSFAEALSALTFLSFGVLLSIAGCVVARYNWKAKRGDIAGATKIATLLAASQLTTFLLAAHHASIDGELDILEGILGDTALSFAIYWLLYLALEPWVRRYWPQTMVTWSRLLRKQFGDPWVGRDLLVGIGVGLASVLASQGYSYMDYVVNHAAPQDDVVAASMLGIRGVLLVLLAAGRSAVANILISFLALFLLKALLRKEWLAGAAYVVLLTLVNLRNANPWYLGLPLWLFLFGTFVLVMLRLGLFAAVVRNFTLFVLSTSMVTTNFSAWYGTSSWIALVGLAGLAAWGLKLSLTGKPVPATVDESG